MRNININQYALAKEKRAEKYKRKRNDSDYFVYKFVDVNNQIIYIGKTIRLPARMVQHFKTDSHLTDECYEDVKEIFYCSLKTKAEMDMYAGHSLRSGSITTAANSGVIVGL